MFLPIRRELLDRGLLQAGTWRSTNGDRLTLFDDERYELRRARSVIKGTYRLERFPEAPWISVVTLDAAGSGLRLHVRYDERAYRPEFAERLSGADVEFSKN